MTSARRLAGLAAACAIAPATSPVAAALWTVAPAAEMSCGANDNYGLAVDRTNRVGTLAVTGVLGAARETESAQTRLDVRATELLLRGDVRQDELQDHVTLSQALAGPVDAWSAGLDFARDDTLQTPASSADLALGRGLQRTHTLNAGWTHHVDERTTLQATAAIARTRYSQRLSIAQDWQNVSLGASLQYLLDERDSADLRVGHADYRVIANDVRSMTDNATAGFTRALGETDKLSIDVGAYRTRTGRQQVVLVCPEDPRLCDGGLVQPVAALDVGHSARWGLQYSGNWSMQLSETTSATLQASRQQDPSGVGVTVRSELLKAGIDRDFSERTHAGASYTRSTSRYEGVAVGQQPRLQTLEAVLSRTLSPRASLRAVADFTRSDAPVSGQHARSASVSLVLRYDWQRLEAHR